MKLAPENSAFSEKGVIDLVIKIILIVLLMAWCMRIILPFTELVLWSVILAITLFPIFSRLTKLLRGRNKLASIIITATLLILIILPAVWMVSSIVDEAKVLAETFKQNGLIIPPADASVAGWPIIGKPLFNAWQLASNNLGNAITTYKEPLTKIAEKFFGSLLSFSSSLFILFMAIIISGLMLVNTQKTGETSKKFASRLLGDKGEEFSDIAIQTVRNVAKGIIGVAFIQFLLTGLVFMLAGIPFAGVWAVVVLFLVIVQLPSGIVGIPVIIYMYTVKDPVPATLWALLIILVSLSDNILKPWLMGKGAPVPMLVIFLGALGGFMFSGFIGLFTGAIVLSLGYKLALMWLDEA
jgi:predicted PurR-regulated permease PerM